MKKTIIIPVIVLAIIISFIGCGKAEKSIDENTSGDSTTVETTLSDSELPTVPKVNSSYNKKLGTDNESKEKLLKDINDNADGTKNKISITGRTDYGYFIYKFTRDPSETYSEEKSEQMRKTAKKNALDFANSLENVYGELNLYKNLEKDVISDGDNGIDSVLYYFYFEPVKTSKYDEVLTVIVDSDGVISYANSSVIFSTLK